MTTSNKEEGAIVRSAVLISTLSAAMDVVRGMADRRRGIDPASQEEPGVARAFLQKTAEELAGHMIALRTGSVVRHAPSGEGSVVLARRMNELMLLKQTAQLLHLMHQRLMSLYPEVGEDLIEEARLLETTCAALRDADDGEDVGTFVGRLKEFLENVRDEV